MNYLVDTQNNVPVSSYNYSLSTEIVSVTPTSTPTFTRNVRRIASLESSSVPVNPVQQKREESRMQSREFVLQMLIGNSLFT